MPRKTLAPTYFTTADIAAAKDCTPHAVSRMMWAARRYADEHDGAMPDWAVPAPEPRSGPRGPLRWRSDRRDVQRWLADPAKRVWK